MSIYEIVAYLAVAYYFILYSTHMLHLLLGYRAALRWKKMGYLEEAHRLSRSEIVPPITIVADLGSMAENAVSWVDHVLSHRFPEIEIVVIFREEDDRRAESLIGTYYLRRVDQAYRRVVEAPRPQEIYQSDDHRLTLVRVQESSGGAYLNLAINLARYPLLAVADGRLHLEEDSLLCLVRPIMEGEINVPAVMGVELPLDMEKDNLLPPRRMTRFSLMESLRIQLGYMTGAPYLGGPVVAYSSLILFRKEDLIDAGGFEPDLSYMGAEMDMTLRLHRLMHEKKKAYRFVYLPQLVVRRPFPQTWREHLREYNMRRRAVSEALSSERDMLFRTRYGNFGIGQLPSFWLFVKLAPVVGFIAFVLSIGFFAAGLVAWPVLVAFLVCSLLYPGLVGAGAVVAARRQLNILKGQGAFLYGYAFTTQLWFRELTAIAPLFNPGEDRG